MYGQKQKKVPNHQAVNIVNYLSIVMEYDWIRDIMAWRGFTTQYDICGSVRKPVRLLRGDSPTSPPHIAMEDVTPRDMAFRTWIWPEIL